MPDNVVVRAHGVTRPSVPYGQIPHSGVGAGVGGIGVQVPF